MPLDNRPYYDKFAGWYERERHHGYHKLIDELELDLIRPFAEQADVLEIGCGTGAILRHVAPLARHAVGLDLSAGMLAQAKERGLCTVLASATDLPFADASFDLVYSYKVLAHIPDIHRALAEAARVLRPGGRAFLELYNRHSLRYWAKRLAGGQKVAADTTERDVFVRWDSPSEMLSYLPGSLEVVGLHGVRVFTPTALAHRIPVLGSVLARAERAAVSRAPWSRWGGFLVIEAVKPVAR